MASIRKTVLGIVFTILTIVVLGILSRQIYLYHRQLSREYFDMEYRLMQARERIQEEVRKGENALQTNYMVLPEKDLPMGVVLRIHEGICMACYRASAEYFARRASEERITWSVVGSYSSEGGFRKTFEPWNIGDASTSNFPWLHLPADGIAVPYVFVLSDSGQVSDVFFLGKTADSLRIDAYLEMLRRGAIVLEK